MTLPTIGLPRKYRVKQNTNDSSSSTDAQNIGPNGIADIRALPTYQVYNIGPKGIADETSTDVYDTHTVGPNDIAGVRALPTEASKLAFRSPTSISPKRCRSLSDLFSLQKGRW